MNVAVFCSGYGSNFQALLDAARKGALGRARIALMVCDRSEAFALKRAAKAGVPILLVSPKLFPERRDYEKLVVRILRSQRIEAVALAGFMRIFTPYFISAFRGRILNIHPSYLPAFKGAHAIRDAFEARVPETGVTVHVVTAAVDNGPILAQQKVPIGRRDTLASLEKKIHRVEHALYPQTLRRFASKTPARY